MFKQFIPPLLAEKEMAAATATPPQASQLPKSAPRRTAPHNCDSLDSSNSVENVAAVAGVRPETGRARVVPGGVRQTAPSPLAQRHQGHPWSARDWHAFFNERAGIAEYSDGLSRAAAEELAFDCCIVEWLNTSRVRPDPGRCAWCGVGSEEGHQLVPYGFGDRQMWLHTRCHVHWSPSSPL